MTGLQLDETLGDTNVSGSSLGKTAGTIIEVHADDPMIAGSIPPTVLVDPSEGPARKKRWHHKTRSGCLTCRRRRVKCDEQRPSCLRCCKVNEKCRYEGSVPQLTLVRYQPSELPAASVNVDLSLLEFFMKNTKDTLSTPPSSLVDRRPVMPLDPDMATARFWKSLGLPLVHTEPLILKLVVLLARKHRQTLEDPKPSDEDLIEVINVMTKIVKTRPQDVVVIGSMLASAFQVLHLTSLGDHSSSGHGVHAIAFSKLLLNSSDAVFEYVKPIADVTRITLAICASAQDERSLDIPENFLDLEDARCYFAEILKLQLSKLRPALEKWLSVMSKLYEIARGKNWEHSKDVLTLFIYGRHILMVSDVVLSVGHELDAVWNAVEERALSSHQRLFDPNDRTQSMGP